MALESIDRAIYSAGRESKLPAFSRRDVLGRLGIPAEKMITDYRGEPLTSAGQTAALLKDRLVEAPDSLDLLVFSGRVDDGWQELVVRAHEVIGRGAGQNGIEHHLAALGDIFSRIGAVRSDFETSEEFNPSIAVQQLVGKVPTLPPDLTAAVQRRVMLVMLSDGKDFVREGQLATELGILDGAFQGLQAASHPAPVIAHLEERLHLRGR